MSLKRTAGSRKKAMKDSIEWLRNNDEALDDIDESAVEVFANLTGVAAPRKMTKKDKKKFIKDSVDWLWDNEAELDDVSDETVQAFTDMTGVSMPMSLTRTAGSRKKAM